jgi:hypothetical protein
MRDGFFVKSPINKGVFDKSDGFRTNSEQTYHCVADEISSVCYEVEDN